MDRYVRTLGAVAFGALLLAGLGLSGALPHLSGGTALTAATVLGDAQGIPPNYTGHTYPDQTSCYINYSPQYGCGAVSCSDLCWSQSYSTNGSQSNSFYTEVFSASAGGVGESQYITSAYTAGYEQDLDIGSACGASTAVNYGNGIVCQGGGENPSYPPSCPSSYPGYDGVRLVTGGPDSNGAYTAECIAYKNVPAALTSTQTTTSSSPSVQAGSPLTLEWSCLPTRAAQQEIKTDQGINSSGQWQFGQLYSITTATGSTGTGSGFTTGNALTGSKTITAPSTPGTYTYTVQCTGGNFTLPTMSIPVTVTPVPPPSCSAYSVSTPVGSGAAATITYTTGGSPTSASITYTLPSGVTISPTTNPASFTPTNSAGATKTTATFTNANYANSTVTVAMSVTNSSGTATCGTQNIIVNGQTPAAPSVSTAAASAVTDTTATQNGSVSATNGSNVTARGFAWSKDSTLRTGVATTSQTGSFGTGAFTNNLTGLTGSTAYYYRAYATNSTGTGYGTIVSFTTAVTDLCVYSASDIPGVQGTVPAGCQTPSPSPGGACIPAAKVYQSSTNTCVYACSAALGGGATDTPGYPNCTCKISGYIYQSATNSCVAPPPPAITSGSFTATPSRVKTGTATSVTFSWSGSNVGSCSIAGTGVNLSNVSSPQTVSLTLTQGATYTLTCTNAGGSDSQTTTVGVVPKFQEI